MKSIMNCTHTPIILRMQTVRTLFLEHVLSRNGNVPWPPHSPDLTNILWFIFLVLFEIKGLTPTNPGKELKALVQNKVYIISIICFSEQFKTSRRDKKDVQERKAFLWKFSMSTIN